MQTSPAEDWQRLTEHYREMSDEALEELALAFGDLTETAQQALCSEMRMRGLDDPAAPKSPGRTRFVRSVDPDAGAAESQGSDGNEVDDGPHEFTWKTLLCECDEQEQAWEISEMLRRAGIESWIERPGSRRAVVWDEGMVGNLQIRVAADQLDQAREVATRPIPQEIINEYREYRKEVPEFEAPTCPHCGAEDPVLESADPVNSWLCEACGKQWTEPVPDAQEER